MDYAQQASNVRPMQPKSLERIGHAADRVMQAAATVAGFIDRYHGPQPIAAAGGDVGVALNVSYSNELERLFANLESIEARICTLCDIG